LRHLHIKGGAGTRCGSPRNGITVDLAELHREDIKLKRVVDFWVQASLETYVIEFTTKGHLSFSKAKVVFRYGLRGRLLKEIRLWIKFLVEEKLLPF